MRTRYPLEFRQQIVELVHAGRNPKEVARELSHERARPGCGQICASLIDRQTGH